MARTENMIQKFKFSFTVPSGNSPAIAFRRIWIYAAFFFFGILGADASNIWDAGGGGNRSVTNPANWDDNIVPNLSDGTQTLTFGTGGAIVRLNAPANISGMVINRDSNLQFTTSNAASNFFTIGSGGILAGPSANMSATYTIQNQVNISANQTWAVQNKSSFSTF